MAGRKILVLEDMPHRKKAFTQGLIGNHVVIVDQSDKCMDLLKNQKWDILFLDHDLGGEEMVPSGPNTGYEVACWLEEFPEHKPLMIVIHSLNNVGREKMAWALPEAFVIPGVWEAENLADIWGVLRARLPNGIPSK